MAFGMPATTLSRQRAQERPKTLQLDILVFGMPKNGLENLLLKASPAEEISRARTETNQGAAYHG
jgi:hypothetical protein